MSTVYSSSNIHIAAAVRSRHKRKHTIWGRDQIWIKKEQMFVKKELIVADTYTSLIIVTQELCYQYTTKIFYIFIYNNFNQDCTVDINTNVCLL